MSNKLNTNVPELRFPEFEGDWQDIILGKLCDKPNYGLGASAIEFDGKHKYLRITDIDDKTRSFLPNPLTSPDSGISSDYRLKENDLVFARTGASVGKSYLYKKEDGELYFAGYLIRFTIKKANAKFIYYIVETKHFSQWVLATSMRSGQPGINAEEYSKFAFLIPSIAEQEKIASFLSAIATRLNQLRRQRQLLQTYKRGVMQKIFSQQIRFKKDDGSPFPDWKRKQLGDVLNYVVREVNKPSENYLSIGIRSHMKGTFQKPGSDPSKIEMDKLYVVHENDLIVNITFAWEGAIAIASKKDHGGFVSHRFPTYVIQKGKSSPQFFKHLIKQEKIKYILGLISPGGAGRNRVLNKKDFLKIKFDFPCVKEQEKIVDFLTAIDQKIDVLSQQIALTEQFKKGLLQKMFV